MKLYLFIFSLLSFGLHAQQGGFRAFVPFEKQALPAQVIELSNKNYLCIVSNISDTLIHAKTKLVILSPRGIVVDSMILSAPDKDLNIYKAVPTAYGLCLVGSMRKDTNNYLWVVNLNQQLRIINEQFKSTPKEVIDIGYAWDRDSTIILSLNYKFNRTAVNTQGKINKKGEIISIKNVFGIAGLPFSNAIVVRKDTSKYHFLFQDAYYECDTSFNNHTLYLFRDIPANIAFRFLSAPEIRIKNDSTFMFAGDCSRGNFLTNAFFAVTKANKYTYFKETLIGGDTSYVSATKRSLDTTKDGRFIYIGGNYSYQESIFNSNNSYLRLTKMDSSYNVIWTKDYGGDANYRLTGIIATSDGGCIMYAARHNHNILQQIDVFVIKVDGNGLVTSTNSIPMPQESIIAYPNPSNGQLQFKKEDPSVSSRFDFNLYDMSGKLVFQKRETDLSETFDLSHLAEGNYMYQIKEREQIISVGKWIKIK
jgi:hypothetical protein